MIHPSIKIDSQPYLLARDQPNGPRAWEETLLELPTEVQERSDVAQGKDGQYSISWADWSGGVAGDIEDLQDGLYWTRNAHGMVPGQLTPVSDPLTSEQTDSTSGTGDLAWCGVFYGDLYTIVGTKVYKWANGTATADRTLAAAATDAIVFNNTLVVALGGSTKIEIRDTAGTWALATDNVYANHFTLVEDRLWRASATNEVSNIGPTDDPGLLASWSTGITVGDDDQAINDLNAYGERVAVSKPSGLYLGDAGAVFPNVLPQFEEAVDSRNGIGTLVKGASIYYPHTNGVVQYSLGNAPEVGIPASFPSADVVGDDMPGISIRAMAVEGGNIWAATETGGFPRQLPTKFMKTVDSGGNYTDYTTNVTDGDYTTGAALGSLDTLANGDWFVVGYSTPFYGVVLDISNPNATGSPTLLAQYWNGAAWTTLDNAAAMSDYTTLPDLSGEKGTYGGTLRRSGVIVWRSYAIWGWIASNLNGTVAYYMRFSVSSALDSTVTVAACTVMTAVPSVYVWRGRTPTSTDARGGYIIWEPYGYISNMIVPNAMVVTHDMYPHYRRDQLVVVGRNVVGFMRLPLNDVEGEATTTIGTSYAVFPKHDAGMPFVKKCFTRIRVRGRGLDSTRTATIYYRVDDDASWTSAVSMTSNTGSAFLSGIFGKKIQIKVVFNAYSGTFTGSVQMPLILGVEAVFYPIPERERLWSNTIVIEDGQFGYTGGALPSADQQLSTLEELVAIDAAPTTHTYEDPMGRTMNVWARELKTTELSQVERERGRVLVQLILHEQRTATWS